MDPDPKILNFPTRGAGEPDSAAQIGKPATEFQNGAPIRKRGQEVEPPPPIWMQRFFLVSIVIFCLWVGMVIAVLPWTPVWTENSLVTEYPRLRSLLSLGFVRGCASGLGVLDLWIGISEAVHYRDRR